MGGQIGSGKCGGDAKGRKEGRKRECSTHDIEREGGREGGRMTQIRTLFSLLTSYGQCKALQ